jgi:hypothetical protein
MTTSRLFDNPIAIDFGSGDLRLRKRRDRSVLAIQPPSETPDGFVAKIVLELSREADTEDESKGQTQRIYEAIIREGLSEAVGKATAKLNAGGIDRTERLLLSIAPIYARVLEQAMLPSSNGALAKDVNPATTRRRVDFDDTVGVVDFILRALDGPGGYREIYAQKLVREAVLTAGLSVSEKVRAAVVSDIAERELPATAAKVEELVVSLLNQRRATLDIEAAVNEYARSGEVDPVRLTPSVRRGMITFLRDLGVSFPAGGITAANRSRFDEYFALAYNNAVRASDGAADDPIDVIRQKGAVVTWDFTVDRFDGIEEQGVVAQNILAAGALDYVYELGERLGMFKIADALVLRWAAGSFDADPGKPSADLYRYWKLRSERISAEERGMMYRRILAKGDGNLLSGMVENESYPDLWGSLMERATDFIRRSEENASKDRTVSRQPIFQATKQLQYNLTEHATGMAHMQITEMYHHLLEAKLVLEHAINFFSTGSRKSLWTVIERASREWFDEAPNISAIRSAAIDGNKVFQWIADFDPSSVSDDQFQVFLDSAESWIIATASDDSQPSIGGSDAEEDDELDEDDEEQDDSGSDWDK